MAQISNFEEQNLFQNLVENTDSFTHMLLYNTDSSLTARSVRDRERATGVRKEEGERAKPFHVPLVGIILTNLSKPFLQQCSGPKAVGCEFCILKMIKTHCFVANNFWNKNFFEFFVIKSPMISVKEHIRPQRIVWGGASIGEHETIKWGEGGVMG